MKHFLIICTGLLLTVFASAQSLETKRLQTSVVTGINFAQIDGDQAVGYEKLGLAAGLQMKYRLNKTFDFSGGLIYSQRGSIERNADKAFTNTTFDISLDYIEAPILLHFKSQDNFSLSAGVAFARLVNSSHEFPQEKSLPEQEEYDFSNSKWDNSFNVNLAYQFTPEFQLNLGWTKSLAAFYQAADIDNKGFFHNMLQVRAVITPSMLGK